MPGLSPLPVPAQPQVETKFGKLLKVVTPMVEGGLIGGFGGNDQVPGSGFQTATNFFNQQQEMDLRRQTLQRQLQNDTINNMLAAARAKHESEIPPFTTGAGRTRTVRGEDGTNHIQEFNVYTGSWEDSGEEAPPTARRVAPLQTEKGIYALEETGPEAGKVTPLTVPGEAPNRPQSPMAMPQPRKPGTGAPLMPPPKAAPAPRSVAPGSRLVDATGKVIAEGAPKPPSASRIRPASADVEAVWNEALRLEHGDVQKALERINRAGLPPEVTAEINRSYRKPTPPKKKSLSDLYSPDQLRQLMTAPR